MEVYSCRMLWMEYFQEGHYNSFDRQDACCESIDKVLDPCLMRWKEEDWAQDFDYVVSIYTIISF